MGLEHHAAELVARRYLVAEELRELVVGELVRRLGLVEAADRAEVDALGRPVGVAYPEHAARRRVVDAAEHRHQQVAFLLQYGTNTTQVLDIRYPLC